MSSGRFGGVLIGLGRERRYDGVGFSKGAWVIGSDRNYESSGRALGEGAGVFLNDRAWTFEVGLYILSFAWY